MTAIVATVTFRQYVSKGRSERHRIENDWLVMFPKHIAREYRKRHHKWLRGQHKNPARKYQWSTAYAWALRKAGMLDELHRFVEGEKRVKENWLKFMLKSATTEPHGALND